MKKYFLAVFVLFLILIFGFSVYAEEKAVVTETVSFDDINYQFDLRLLPKVHYNPIECWRFGGVLNMQGLFGPDMMELWAEYSFKNQSLDSGFTYLYTIDNNFFYLNLYDDLHLQGFYGSKALWQRDLVKSIGFTSDEYSDDGDGYYIADLMFRYWERMPANSPGGYTFDQGKDLAIYPTIFGSYQGYQGKFEMVYSFPSEISDYNYIRANALLKKGFDLTYKDRLVLTGEVGVIRGEYPFQQRFFLGSSPNNFVPNTVEKMLGVLGQTTKEAFTSPKLYLDGYLDNVFSGENMYLVKVEYQRKLWYKNFVELIDVPFYLLGKAYVTFGDAWTGEISRGFEDPKTTVGIGLNIEPKYLEHLQDKEFYVGINLAHGLGDEAVTTIGFEVGTTIQLLDFFNFMIK